MNEHLTEQQLIDYAFDLATDAGKLQVKAHLEQCDACRRQLTALKGKFASLDLLRDEIQASPELLAQTVTAATNPPPVRRLPIWRHTWLGAAAAVIVVGFSLLVVPMLQPDRAPQTPAADAPVTEIAPAPKMKDESFAAAPRKTAARDGKGAKLEAPAPAAPAPVRTLMTTDSAPMAGMAMAPSRKPTDEIAEKPPFAPASAIELVVLPRREDVQLTIYNGADLTLVRERRQLTLKKGWNWLQFMWAGTLIDPTSLTLEPKTHQDQVEVQQLVFPPRLRELGRWLIRSETSGQVPFELTYLTSGLAWRAFYMGTLSQDEKTMDLQGYVRVDNNSGEEYENAQTRLIVGKVHLLDQIRELAQRQYAYGSPVPDGRGAGMMGGMGGRAGVKFVDTAFRGAKDDRLTLLGDVLERKEIRKEGLSEYFLYTIEGTETIPNEWGKRLLSFEIEDIPVKSLYKYDERRWGRDPLRFVSFANDNEHELGESPLPNGQVRIYGRADAERHLSYVGGSGVKYIPVGEEIELNLGQARLVKVEPTLMDFATDNYVFDSNDNITGWDERRSWKVEVTNARTLPIDIEVTREFETTYWDLSLEQKRAAYEKHDATRARFRLRLDPREEYAFRYTVTTYHGVREEAFVRKQKR